METYACSAEFTTHDFDGGRLTIRCDHPAEYRVVTHAASAAAYIAFLGGWEVWRAECLAHGEEDPGEDPGQDDWGQETDLLCGKHMEELLRYAADAVADETPFAPVVVSVDALPASQPAK